jgi:uncharacterized protein (DUF2141 family)
MPEVSPMRHFPFLVLSAALYLAASTAGAASGETVVRIVVTNVEKQDGVLLVGAYSSADTWLGATTVATREVPVKGNLRDGTVTLEMPLAPGNYALSVLQDMNGNRRLDTNVIGIPTEHSGSSNDAPARFSAPKFKDAVIAVGDKPVELRIRLN